MIALFASLFSGVVSLITFSWLWNCFNFVKGARKNTLKRENAKVKKLLGFTKLEEKLSDVSIDDSEIIQNLDTPTLVDYMKQGKYKPEDVLKAYQKFALIAQRETNCITAIIEEAETESKELENQPREGRMLYGIPICIKDDLAVKGYDQTYGCANRLENPLKEDSIIIQVLKHHGAIPFVRTNLPQTSISYECSNPIYGCTQNPHKKGRSPGGSSGGNGALLGLKGSPVGIGSDLGGSIRIPSHFCGIVGFKPTSGRLSLRKNNALLPGAELLLPTYGPMGRDVKSVSTVMKALASDIHFQLDESIPPMIFNEHEFTSNKKLRIGYFTQNGLFPAAPAVQRAVEIAKDKLGSLGHEMIDCSDISKEIDLKISNELMIDCILLDNGKAFRANVKGDALDPSIRKQIYILAMPDCVKKFLKFLVSFVDKNASKAIGQMIGRKDVSSYYQRVCKRNEFRESMFSIWKNSKLDAMICPPCGVYAPPHYKFSESTSLACSYSSLWNIVNYPAGVVPVTKVNKADDENLKSYYKQYCKQYLHKLAYNGLKDGIGLPVGVQVVTLPFRDELCLNVMSQLETSIKREGK